MCRRRALLFDFSSREYEAQRVVLKMRSSPELHVLLPVLGTGGRRPRPPPVSAFAEPMARHTCPVEGPRRSSSAKARIRARACARRCVVRVSTW